MRYFFLIPFILFSGCATLSQTQKDKISQIRVREVVESNPEIYIGNDKAMEDLKEEYVK